MIGWREEGPYYAQHDHTIGYTGGKTLRLSNLSPVLHRESGVTLRRVALSLSHI